MPEDFSNIMGSWFPTGYHGHFRDKCRPEVVNSYRQRAKPAPPTKFLNRSKVRSDQHLFSRHDNRHSHATSLGDLEMYFEMGLGKRKPQGSIQHWKNTSSLLTWANDAPRTNGTLSTYQKTYLPPTPREFNRACVNEMEPIHCRSGANLYRRQTRPPSSRPVTRTAPLLAWNEPDETSNAKPAVGNPFQRRRMVDRYQDQLRNGTVVIETLSPLP